MLDSKVTVPSKTLSTPNTKRVFYIVGVKNHYLQEELKSEYVYEVRDIFEDSEAKSNLVSFFDLALKVHMRHHPELYRRGSTAKSHD